MGDRSGQGKTSVFDSIAWILGGNRYKQSNVKREGPATNPHLKVVLSNILVVERKGRDSDLKGTARKESIRITMPKEGRGK